MVLEVPESHESPWITCEGHEIPLKAMDYHGMPWIVMEGHGR